MAKYSVWFGVGMYEGRSGFTLLRSDYGGCVAGLFVFFFLRLRDCA